MSETMWLVPPTETPSGNHWDRLEDAIAYMTWAAPDDGLGWWDVIAVSIVDALGRLHCDQCQIGADVDFDEAGDVHVWGVHEYDCPGVGARDEPTITRVQTIDVVGHPA